MLQHDHAQGDQAQASSLWSEVNALLEDHPESAMSIHHRQRRAFALQRLGRTEEAGVFFASLKEGGWRYRQPD